MEMGQPAVMIGGQELGHWARHHQAATLLQKLYR